MCPLLSQQGEIPSVREHGFRALMEAVMAPFVTLSANALAGQGRARVCTT